MIIVFAKRNGIAACPPRKPSSWGWFSTYDGNIVGCLLLGAGMALTGSCPGTVMVQVGMGLRSGFEVLAGSLLGGVLFSGYAACLKRPVPAAAEGEKKDALTVYQKLGVKEISAVLGYQAACFSVVLAAMRFLPDSQGRLLNPLVGGLLMGSSQLISLVLTSNTLGVSSAFEVAGKLFWRVKDQLTGTAKTAAWPDISSILFAAGIAAGSAAFWRFSGTPIPVSAYPVTSGKAVLGGLLMAFGSRVAGGCTSGHGISGMATLSISSIASVASMFGGGIALSLALKGLGY